MGSWSSSLRQCERAHRTRSATAERVRAHWRERTQPPGRGADRSSNTTTSVAFRWTVRLRGNANPRQRGSAPRAGRLCRGSAAIGIDPPCFSPSDRAGPATPPSSARQRTRTVSTGATAGASTTTAPPTTRPWTCRPGDGRAADTRTLDGPSAAHMTTGATTDEVLTDPGKRRHPEAKGVGPLGRLAEPRIRSDWDWARCFSNVTGQAPPARQPRRDRGLAPSRIARNAAFTRTRPASHTPVDMPGRGRPCGRHPDPGQPSGRPT